VWFFIQSFCLEQQLFIYLFFVRLCHAPLYHILDTQLHSNSFPNIAFAIIFSLKIFFTKSFPLKSSDVVLPSNIFKIKKLILSIYVSYNGFPSGVFDFDKRTSLLLFLKKSTKYFKIDECLEPKLLKCLWICDFSQ